MQVRGSERGQIELTVSLEQLKRIYTSLFCQLQTGGCKSFEELEDDLLLDIQRFLQKEAAAQGVDCTNHDAWEEFVGIRHADTCPRKPEDAPRP